MVQKILRTAGNKAEQYVKLAMRDPRKAEDMLMLGAAGLVGISQGIITYETGDAGYLAKKAMAPVVYAYQQAWKPPLELASIVAGAFVGTSENLAKAADNILPDLPNPMDYVQGLFAGVEEL